MQIRIDITIRTRIINTSTQNTVQLDGVNHADTTRHRTDSRPPNSTAI